MATGANQARGHAGDCGEQSNVASARGTSGERLRRGARAAAARNTSGEWSQRGTQAASGRGEEHERRAAAARRQVRRRQGANGFRVK